MQQTILDALRDGDIATALTSAREMVAAQPGDPTAHRLLAAALRADGQQQAAIAAIDEAIALLPEEPALHLERASLLLDARQLDRAQEALAHTTGLDPNQFPAYVMQAHVALARGDLDEAQRLARTAGRIAPLHPRVAALEGMLALRRGDADRALVILTDAIEQAPDEPQLRHALGMAYLARGHHAFAEQAFRGLLEHQPDSSSLRIQLARTLYRQGRAAEAAEMLVPLVEGTEPRPGLQRMLGQLWLHAGQVDQGLSLLRQAFQARPADRRTLLVLVDAWRRLDRADEARSTLDAALGNHPQIDDLWRARLLFEEFAGDGARAVVGRWQAARPDHVPALEAMVAIHDRAGEAEQAEAVVARILEVEPGHDEAQLRTVDRLLLEDPDSALVRVESLIAASAGEEARRWRSVLSRCHEATGRYADAAAIWTDLHAEVAADRTPLPAPTAKRGADAWPALAARDPASNPQVFVWGPPGSLVERVAAILQQAGLPLLDDRFGPHPPDDLFQKLGGDELAALAEGRGNAAAQIATWRTRLKARGVRDEGTVLDWLPHWDNAFLAALRPQMPEATLLAILRDPRDMLLAWLGYGSPAPFALPSAIAGARWLAGTLDQVADLHEQALLPHRLLRIDEHIDDAAALSGMLGEALQVRITLPRAPRFGSTSRKAGHWRHYTGPLADAFAELAPVARRLGYPED